MDCEQDPGASDADADAGNDCEAKAKAEVTRESGNEHRALPCAEALVCLNSCTDLGFFVCLESFRLLYNRLNPPRVLTRRRGNYVPM